MDIKVAITRATLFIAVYAIVLGLPFLFAFKTGFWVWSLVMMAAFASGGPFLFLLLKDSAEKILLAEQKRYQQILLQASSGMLKQHDLDKLLKLTVYIIKRAVKIKFAAAFIHNKSDHTYELRAIRNGKIKLFKYAFLEDHPLIAYIQKHRDPFTYDDLPQEIKDAIELKLGINLVVPSFIENELLGFILLGNKVNNMLYSEDDINIFITLSNQAALAIENCNYLKEYSAAKQKMYADQKRTSLLELMSGIVHKVKNMLGGICLPAQGVQESLEDLYKANPSLKTNENVKKYHDEVLDAVKRIDANGQKINNVFVRAIDLAQAGVEDAVFEKHSLKQLIGIATETIKSKYTVNALPLETEIPANDLIYGVKSRLVDILENILSNAYIATVEILDYIDYEKKKDYRPLIKVSLTNRGNAQRITITDNGVGMREDGKKKVFAPFRNTGSRFMRSGMGTYVIKPMVEDIHNGKIWFNSEFMQGTTFYVELPSEQGESYERSSEGSPVID
ncbi:MAG: ATP-binding protein [Endomicrobiales bacterium]